MGDGAWEPNYDVDIWDRETGQITAILRGHKGQVIAASYNIDGTRIVTASGRGTSDGNGPTLSESRVVKVWDAQTGENILTSPAPEGDFTWAAFSPDGSRLVTATTGGAKIWDARTGTMILKLKGHTAAVILALYSPDGSRIVTAANDKTGRIWDAATGDEL